MAIKKQIITSNGVPVEYHRVAMVKIDTNQQNTILVLSYLSEDARKIEKDYAAGKYKDVETGAMVFPYTDAQYINTKYISDMSIESAYEYLKTLPMFEGAEDILEPIPTTNETTEP